MPQLGLTDIVSIIFSVSFLWARTAAVAQMMMGWGWEGGQGGSAPDWIEAFFPGAKVFDHKRKLSFIKYLTQL